MSSDPKISVVITTYNRQASVRKMLELLDQQTLPPESFEVVVADDGSPDETPEMIAELLKRVRYNLRHLRHKNQGPGAAQNLGIRDAACDIVLLLADDIMPSPRMLEEHLKSHTEHPEDCFAVLGKVIQSPELPRDALHKVWDPFQYDRFDGRTEVEGFNFMGCNISFKKSFMVANGMYRERAAIAHEDIELGYRLMTKGLRIIYNSCALAYHEHVESLEKICTRAYERGRNFDLLEDNLPPELVFPLYKIHSLKAGVGPYLRMLPREVARKAAFNGLTVNAFWLPILRQADASAWAAPFASNAAYRGVSGYFMRKGYHERQREKRQGSRTMESPIGGA